MADFRSPKLIQKVPGFGSVIITTISSFLVQPPTMFSCWDSPIQWNNLLTFIAGFLYVIILSSKAPKPISKRKLMILFTLAIISIFVYGFIYQTYSVQCYDSCRCIISYAEPIKNSKTIKTWPNDINGIRHLLESRNCNPSATWHWWNLLPIFSIIFAIYLYIVIFIIKLSIFLYEKGVPKKTTP
jgi:hypothetical protein